MSARRILVTILAFVTCLSGVGWIVTFSSRSDVALLYTQKSKYPDFAFRLSSIPLAFASYLKFGQRSFSLLPATRENIEKTLSESKVVVVGTHGSSGGISSDDGFWIGPDNIPNLSMKLIYFGSCYFGDRRNDWETKFPNARVLGHDKLTYPWIGWRYLVLNSWLDIFKIDQIDVD